MTTVHIEPATLGRGTAVLYKDYGNHVRIAYDPARTDEEAALQLVTAALPRLGLQAHGATV